NPANFSEVSTYGLLFGIFFVTLLGHPINTWINCQGSALMASTSAFVQPIFGVIISVSMGREPYDLGILFSVVLMIGGLALIFADRSRAKAAAGSTTASGESLLRKAS